MSNPKTTLALSNSTSPTQHKSHTRTRARNWRPRFLAALSRHPDVKRACQFAGVPRRTAYDAKERDETFAAAWNAAIAASIDEVEAKVMEAGKKGDMNVAMFLLRCHKPSIYRDTNRVEIDQRLVGVLVVPSKEQLPP
jgi:hypothetical protein